MWLAARRAIRFVADQAVKTRRRPSRLVIIPFNLLLQPFLSKHATFVGPAMFVLVRALRIPAKRLPKPLARLLAHFQFYDAVRLLNENRPDDSWRVFQRCLPYSDNHFHFKLAAVCLYAGLGRMREAIELFRQSNKIRQAYSERTRREKHDKHCLLDDFWTSHIGHTAQIDYIVKQRLLGGHDPKDTILYVPQLNNLPNRFLVEQWAPYLRVVSDGKELPYATESVQYHALDFYVPDLIGVGKYYLWELAAQTYRRWAAEGRQPLLRLAEGVRNRGRDVLQSLGIPRDAWFVALHVRDRHFQSHHRDLHDVLNANIEDYLPAIEEITRRGGWIIRMGDSAMPRLPALPNVLDYCHSAVRSDWMDVYLAASCQFFIGTPSGVCYVAQDYGVPCVLTNWWPPAQRPWHDVDIFIPKLLRRMKDGRILSLEQSLNEPFGYCNSVRYLQNEHHVTVHANDPMDIHAAVIEMFERIANQPRYDQNDLAMRERADRIYASVAMELYNSPGAFGAASLARGFLKRYPSFVGS